MATETKHKDGQGTYWGEGAGVLAEHAVDPKDQCTERHPVRANMRLQCVFKAGHPLAATAPASDPAADEEVPQTDEEVPTEAPVEETDEEAEEDEAPETDEETADEEDEADEEK
jgi:hypothetical protein